MPVLPMKLETERLCLEPTKPEHADPLWEAIESSLPELKPWLAWAAHASPDETRKFAQRSYRGWLEGQSWDFIITLGGEPIGNIGLNRYVPLWRSCNLGYWLRTDLHGNGYMTESASAVVDFAFVHARLHRIEVVASPDNPGSWRVAEKIGFQREGVLRDGCWTEQGFLDMYMYGLLSTDPRPRLH